MQTTDIPPGSIVVGVDGSTSAVHAVAWAADQAVLEHRPLTLAHGTGHLDGVWMAQSGIDHRVVVEARREEGRRVLSHAREVALRAGDLVVHEALRAQDAREMLHALAADAALLVVGSRGRGPVRSLLLGSVSVAATRHAPCTVVVVRPHHPGEVRRGVLVGADGTDRSLRTLEYAYRQASLRDLPLTVLHSYWDARHLPSTSVRASTPIPDLDDVRMLVSESISGLGEKYPEVGVRVELVRGLADDCLIHAARQMEMVVVGAHRRSPVSNLVYGSVASAVIEHAACVVAVVPDAAG